MAHFVDARRKFGATSFLCGKNMPDRISRENRPGGFIGAAISPGRDREPFKTLLENPAGELSGKIAIPENQETEWAFLIRCEC